MPTAPDQWRYLMILTFNVQILLDTRITFGGVAGCGSFGRVADAWKEVMLANFPLLAAFRWVDDTMFVKRKFGGPALRLGDISCLSKKMGVVENVEKRNDFADEQKYLGFMYSRTSKASQVA